MLDSGNWKLAVGVTAAVASGMVAGSVMSKLKADENRQTPKKWVKVGTIKNIIIYPVKSCKGIFVEEAEATPIGLKASDFLRDRVFMVVDERYVFQTQRTLPKMALITVDVNGNQLTLSGPDQSPVTIDIPEEKQTTKVSCRIFDDHVAQTLDCGDEVGKWLESFLDKKGLRLVFHFQEATQRKLNSLQKKFPSFSSFDKGSFQDQTSYMIMSKESIDELNSNLETTQISHRNFRPSILVEKTPNPFSEDMWTFVKVGDKGPVLKASKPCTRCKLTTVNPDTGTFIESGEPLSVLTKMQRTMGNDTVDKLVKNQGIIGLQLGLFEGSGKLIKSGDPVYVAVL